MIDICFDGSLGGMLTLERKNHALGDTPRNVVTMELYLDVGDLSQGVFSESRKETAAALFKGQWLGKRSFVDKRHWDATLAMLEKIKDYALSGGKLRIWYAQDADSYSSFMWLVSELEGIKCDIIAVCLSDTAFEIEPFCTSWARVEPDQLAIFVAAESVLTNSMRRNISQRWENICSSALPLRTVVNGSVVPVKWSFYDNLIMDNVPDTVFTHMEVMHHMMVNTNMAIPFSFITKRMTELFSEHCNVVDKKKNSSPREIDCLVFEKK